MNLFLGVDGGQTATRVVLADEEGQILAQATGGPSNHTEEPGGPERLERVIRETVNKALAESGRASIDQQEFAAACLGMTGETAIKQRILERLIKARHLLVVHDSVNALMGATAGKPGLIVIAGTGSVARGMDAQGRQLRVGGWGHLFGDEGSAYWIGREAIRAAASELDGFGEPTSLTPLLLTQLAVPSAYALMEKYYSGEWSREHMAGLARWVSGAASDGDRVAQVILRDAGRRLASSAITLISVLFTPKDTAVEQAGLANGPLTAEPLVSCVGGVFENQFVLAEFKAAVQGACPDVRIDPPLLPPVLGSLLLAYRSEGILLPDRVHHNWANVQPVQA
jgi:N-acetylglucosamine kinase-like BadF-type ATPase